MWGAVEGVRGEVEHRGNILEADPTAEFPMLVLMIDEINFLSVLTKAHWLKIRTPQQPKNAPFWDDLLIVLAAGRQFRIHVIIVGQDLRETALGNIGLRAMIGLRGIAGYDRAMWVRFMQTMPIPRVPGKVGRWYFQAKGNRVLVQNAFGEPQEIVDLGRGGRPMSQVPELSQLGGGVVETWDTNPGQPVNDLVIGLEDGAKQVGLSVSAFRKRRQRAAGGIPGETKVGNQPAWTPKSLDAFFSREEVKAS
jgi:hypothetical protein